MCASEIVRLIEVKTFLDFNRPVALHLLEVPLESFVEDRGAGQPLAESAGIAVSVEQRAGEPIRVDRGLLKQAILNIVMNAVEAMPADGRCVSNRPSWAKMPNSHCVRLRHSSGAAGKDIPAVLTTKEKARNGLAMTFGSYTMMVQSTSPRERRFRDQPGQPRLQVEEMH
jgi:hypothetical protein